MQYYLLHAEGEDFIGPNPSVLTFTSGQSMGGIQCANVTILDDNVVEGHTNFSIRLTNNFDDGGDGSDGGGGEGGGGGGGSGGGGHVQIDANVPEISINIAIDIRDSEKINKTILR